MSTHRPAPASHLFLLRVWRDGRTAGAYVEASPAHPVGDVPAEPGWQGKVQHVVSGTVYNFQSWTALVDYLPALLAQLEQAERGAATNRDEENTP